MHNKSAIDLCMYVFMYNIKAQFRLIFFIIILWRLNFADCEHCSADAYPLPCDVFSKISYNVCLIAFLHFN